ncbi:putative linker histone H1/H5, domain H15, AT hook, DNA-binding protein [Helianthus annuus]|nr:putative linker histone H1/H5, domain H15, AT hook, DNA-binding protein [Helianthus annuus]
MESFAPPEHHATPPFSGNSAHPPYPEMIMAAIAALDDKDGSSRQAIAKYIEREYSNLPPTHPNLLTHHLKRMKNEGQLIMIKHSYALPPPRSVPFVPDEQQPPEIQPYPPQFETQTQTHLGQGESEGNYAEPPIFASLGLADDAPRENALVSAKRGRGRPPKSANASGGTASVGGSEGRRKRGRPKLLSISRVNGGVSKRGRPKRIGGIVTVPLSGNVASPRGRPKRAVSGDARSGSVSRGRGRPPKNKFRNSFGSPSKVGPGTAVIVTDPHQLVAYQELKLKYEHLQSKAKEVVGVVRPYINPDYEAFGALQELEMLVGTYAVVESEKRQPYA